MPFDETPRRPRRRSTPAAATGRWPIAPRAGARSRPSSSPATSSRSARSRRSARPACACPMTSPIVGLRRHRPRRVLRSAAHDRSAARVRPRRRRGHGLARQGRRPYGSRPDAAPDRADRAFLDGPSSQEGGAWTGALTHFTQWGAWRRWAAARSRGPGKESRMEKRNSSWRRVAAIAGVAAMVFAACASPSGSGGAGKSVTVIGTWGGDEQKAFLAMVKPWEAADRRHGQVHGHPRPERRPDDRRRLGRPAGPGRPARAGPDGRVRQGRRAQAARRRCSTSPRTRPRLRRRSSSSARSTARSPASSSRPPSRA